MSCQVLLAKTKSIFPRSQRHTQKIKYFEIIKWKRNPPERAFVSEVEEAREQNPICCVWLYLCCNSGYFNTGACSSH